MTNAKPKQNAQCNHHRATDSRVASCAPAEFSASTEYEGKKMVNFPELKSIFN